MKIEYFVKVGVVLCFLAVILIGCTPEQVDQVDQTLADANSVATGVVDLVRGPAGAVFPPMVRTIAEVLGIGLAAALGLWKQLKHNLTKDALRAVTKGVENVSDGTNEVDRAAVEAVKEKVRQEMLKLSARKMSVDFAMLNAEVDRAKAS